MHDHAPDDTIMASRTKRRRALLAILLGASLATLGAGTMSLAVFTSSDTSTGAWSTGTIAIDAKPDNDPTVAFTSGDMYPGDKGQQTITVKNTGTGELRYDMSTALDDPDGLLAAMTLDVNEGACGGSVPASSGTFGTASLSNIVLASGDTDTYCFVWGLPGSAGNGLQGTSGQATFTFDAEQTANNP
jgi:spore coat-associated protein N